MTFILKKKQVFRCGLFPGHGSSNKNENLMLKIQDRPCYTMQIKINRKQISSINIRQRIRNKNTLNGRKNVILRSKI